MSCPVIDLYRKQVCASMAGKVEDYQHQLQSKWGDPRVYAQQESERLRQDARLAYDLSQRTEGLLSEAYAKQAQKNRDAHAERLKRRDYQTSGKPPESAARPTRKRQPR